MLKWCIYCQQFQGEVLPYEDQDITHGMCAPCFQGGAHLTESALEQARSLKSIQVQLMRAGKDEDLDAAARIIDLAMNAGLRPVDILLGLVAPLLYEIGEEWKRAAITAADEHRFTTFCEHVFELVEGKANARTATDPRQTGRVLLLNAHGNVHTLALRTLALWLLGEGIVVQTVYPSPSCEALVELVRTTRPGLVLISMALAEHHASAVKIVESIRALPGPLQPEVIVGGYAVKLGLVPPIPGARLLEDIYSLPEVCPSFFKGRQVLERAPGRVRTPS